MTDANWIGSGVLLLIGVIGFAAILYQIFGDDDQTLTPA